MGIYFSYVVAFRNYSLRFLLPFRNVEICLLTNIQHSTNIKSNWLIELEFQIDDDQYMKINSSKVTYIAIMRTKHFKGPLLCVIIDQFIFCLVVCALCLNFLTLLIVNKQNFNQTLWLLSPVIGWDCACEGVWTNAIIVVSIIIYLCDPNNKYNIHMMFNWFKGYLRLSFMFHVFVQNTWFI